MSVLLCALLIAACIFTGCSSGSGKADGKAGGSAAGDTVAGGSTTTGDTVAGGSTTAGDTTAGGTTTAGDTASGGTTTEDGTADGTGTNPGGNNSGAGAADHWTAQEKVQIRFATNETQTDDKKAAWAKIIEAYNEIQPNIEIELVPIDWENHRTWLTMQLTGGTAPEVVHSKLSWATDDFNKGLILDISDMMAGKNPYTQTDTWEDFYAPAVITQMKAVSSSYYSVCNYMSIVKLFYNKEMFKDAGITQLPETWSEFLDAQKKLKDAGYAPFSFPNSKPADNLYNWSERLLTYQVVEDLLPELDVNGSGTIETNEIVRGIDLDIINITKSPFADVFPMLKEWSQYWAEGYNAIDDTTAKQMFIRQETAMMLGFPSTVEDMKQMGTTFDYGVFTFPYLTKADNEYACEQSYEMGANVTEVYCIPSNVEGDQLLAAKDFLMFLGSPQGMAMVADLLFLMPTAAEAVTDSLDGWAPEGKTVKLNLYGPAVDQTFSDDSVMFGQLYLEGRIDLDEYLDEMQTSLKDMAQRLKDTNGWSEENNYLIVE